MSLPTVAHFYYKEKQVTECFINCGWFYDERETKLQIVNFINQNDKFDWNYVIVYDQKFTKNEDFTGNHPTIFYDVEFIKRKECKKDPDKTYIDEFRGEYRWLSNFYLVDVEYDGDIYPSVEHAYMSAKSDDMAWKMFCMNSQNTAGQVKKDSREIDLTDGWGDIKLNVMRECLIQKFNHKELKNKLLATKDAIIREGNRWNDTYWGVCLRKGYGDNHLGRMIMDIRKSLNEDVGVGVNQDIKNILGKLKRTAPVMMSEYWGGVQPMNPSLLKNLMEIKVNKIVEVKEYIVRTSRIEYDEASLGLSKELTEQEILQDVASAIEARGLNACRSIVSENVETVKLNGVDLNDIQAVSIKDKQ